MVALNLVRRLGEKIVIGDNIVITVIDVSRGGAVRLGIVAPKEVTVHRQEIYEAILRGEIQRRESDC